MGFDGEALLDLAVWEAHCGFQQALRAPNLQELNALRGRAGFSCWWHLYADQRNPNL